MKNRNLQNASVRTNNRHTCSRRRFLQSAMVSTVPFLVSTAPQVYSNSSAKKASRVFWGDLHTHTNLSDGNGDPEDNFEIARSHLDFWTMADHGYDEIVFSLDYRKRRQGRRILNDHWELIQQLCRDYEKPGRFIPFLGYEWTNFQYGHHNVYYLQYNQPIRMPPTLPELYASLRNVDAMAIPHHPGYPVGICGKDWNYHDDRLSPFVEIYSVHGSSEEPEGIRPLLTSGSWMGPGSSGGSVQEGLARGYRLGISASSDSHGGHPGAYDLGMIGVHATDLSRESLWEAFQNRRVFGITGDRISLDFSLNGHPMGSVLQGEPKRILKISAVGWNKVDRIDVIKNNSIFHTFIEPTGPTGRPVAGRKMRFRFLLEWGKDNMGDRDWDGSLTVGEGRILHAVPCFRGNVDSLVGRGIKNLSGSECQWKSKTRRSQGIDAIAFEVECTGQDTLQFRFTCSGLKRDISLSPVDILGKSIVKYMEEIPSTNDGAYWHEMKDHSKFKVHKGWLTGQLTLSLTCEDNFPEHPHGRADFYYVRLTQRNGQRAWSSPIWVQQ